MDTTKNEFLDLAKKYNLEVETSDLQDIDFSEEEFEDLEKNAMKTTLKGLALAAGIAGISNLAFPDTPVDQPTEASVPAPIPDQTTDAPRFTDPRFDPPTPKKVDPMTAPFWARGLKRDTLHPDMRAIAQLETAGGILLDHEKHSGGPFHTAYGPLGLKPVTAYEQYLRTPSLRESYPGLEDKDVFLNHFWRNQDLYNKVAGAHWEWLKQRNKGDLARTAFSWRWGLGAANKATREMIQQDDYAQKYLQLRDKFRRQGWR